MINLLHAEWIKLRTVTMNWVLGIIAGAFPLAVTLLTAYFNGDSSEFGTSDLASVLGGTTVVCALLCGVIAAASITSEFGFGTIRPTFAATPQRLRVVVAKGAVVVLATTTLATVVQLVGWFAGSAIARGRGATIDLAEVPTAVPAMVGAVVLTALVQGLLVQSYFVPSASLSPSLEPGDRALVWKVSPALDAGDVVVVDTTATAAIDRATPVDDGLAGRVLTPLANLLGVDTGRQDHLAVVGAADGDEVSLVAPVTGAVPASVSRDDIVGTAVLRVWPLSRFGTIDTGTVAGVGS